MDFSKYEEIEKLENKLLEVLQNEYGGEESLYVCIDNIELSYILCEPGEKPTVTIKIRYGYQGSNDSSWQKEMELYYEKDNADFLAGQFFQALLAEEGAAE